MLPSRLVHRTQAHDPYPRLQDPEGFLAYADKMSPLGNATALECADYTISMFSDLTKKVTLQNLFHDGGFSNMGVSDAVMDKFIEE